VVLRRCQSVSAYGVVFGELFEDIDKEVSEYFEDFVIVLFDLHLKVEADELAQMPIGIGVLSAEDGADLKDFEQIRQNGHLLEQLRRLRQTCGITEV
jgi:hypothetical protein